MKNDKNLIIGFIIFGIFVLIFGFFRIRESIAGPFRLPQIATAQLTAEDVHHILAQRDTDGDGLTDYEEIFIYNTSIFLVDTDGDGFTDYEEVMAGSDPLDPASTPLNPYPAKPRPIGEITTEETRQETIIPGDIVQEPSIDEIRNFLIRAGIDREILNQVDDETLRRLYNETVVETGVQPGEATPGGFEAMDFSNILKQESPQIDIAELENLTPQEIRQIMIMADIDPNILDQIDDQTLMMLFFQALQEMQ